MKSHTADHTSGWHGDRLSQTPLLLIMAALLWACPPGLSINSPSASQHPFLLLVDFGRKTLHCVNLTTNQSRVVLQSGQPRSVTFDPVRDLVYYTDMSSNRILSVTLDGQNVTTLMTHDSTTQVRGITVDPFLGLIFYGTTWITSRRWSSVRKGYLYRMDVSGGGHRQILGEQYLAQPSDLSVDVIYRLLFYVDFLQPGVGRLDYDGSNHRVLASSKMQHPIGLAFHPQEGRLYWSDQEEGVVETIKVDGTDRRTVYKSRSTLYDVALLDSHTLIFSLDGQSGLKSMTTSGTSVASFGSFYYISQVTSIFVFRPLSITRTPVCEGDFSFIEGQTSAQLSCDAPGDVNVTWFKDGRQLSGVSKVLRFDDVTEATAGRYWCADGHYLSGPVTVTVQFPPRVRLSVTSLTVSEGATVSVACYVTSIPKAYNVTWSRQSTGAIVSKESILTLESVTSEAAGLYVCTAVNILTPCGHESRQGQSSSELEVRVVAPTSSPPVTPTPSPTSSPPVTVTPSPTSSPPVTPTASPTSSPPVTVTPSSTSVAVAAIVVPILLIAICGAAVLVVCVLCRRRRLTFQRVPKVLQPAPAAANNTNASIIRGNNSTLSAGNRVTSPVQVSHEYEDLDAALDDIDRQQQMAPLLNQEDYVPPEGYYPLRNARRRPHHYDVISGGETYLTMRGTSRNNVTSQPEVASSRQEDEDSHYEDVDVGINNQRPKATQVKAMKPAGGAKRSRTLESHGGDSHKGSGAAEAANIQAQGGDIPRSEVTEVGASDSKPNRSDSTEVKVVASGGESMRSERAAKSNSASNDNDYLEPVHLNTGVSTDGERERSEVAQVKDKPPTAPTPKPRPPIPLPRRSRLSSVDSTASVPPPITPRTRHRSPPPPPPVPLISP